MSAMTIGELAARAGVGVETLRYYERRGLVPEPERGPNGYRRYSEADLTRLRLIARAKSLGFTLTEIADLVDSGDAVAVVERAQAKLADIERQRAELAERRDRLVTLVDGCTSGDVGCTSFEI